MPKRDEKQTLKQYGGKDLDVGMWRQVFDSNSDNSGSAPKKRISWFCLFTAKSFNIMHVLFIS